MSEEETVVDSAETTTDLEDNDSSNEDSTGEDEATQETEGSDNSQSGKAPETPEQRLARLKRQYERELKKQGIGSTEAKESGQEGSKEGGEVDEKYLRLELKTEGLKSTKEQDIVLNYIKDKAALGQEVTVEAAMKSLVVKEALSEVRRTESVPRPSRRTGGAADSIDYYVGQIKKGNMKLSDVPDKEMRVKITRMRNVF